VRIAAELRERLRALFHRARGEGEMEEELRFHIEMQMDENIRLGMEPGEARRRAAIAFGGVERVKEEVREARGLGPVGRLASDVGYAVRSFRSGRSGLLVSALVLAAAIGAGTTVYSVVSGVLLESLPYRDMDRLVKVGVAPLKFRAEDDRGATLADKSVELIRSGTGSFEATAYLTPAGQPELLGMGEPERISVWNVEPQLFQVLGSDAFLGRTLGPADASAATGNPVVMSHRLWMSHFGGAADILGRTFRLGDRVDQVVGVMPPDFDFPAGAQLWQVAPPRDTTVVPVRSPQGGGWLVGRLADGVSAIQARDRIDARFTAYGQENSAFAEWGPTLLPLRHLLSGPVRKPLLLLLAAVSLVLLIACANVAAVLLTRGISRRRELAIRVAMGAPRGRVARQLVIEAVLLSLLSGGLGTLIALGAVPILVSLMSSELPATASISVDGRVLAATLLASTVTGLVAGVLPALLVARERFAEALRDGGDGAGSSSWRNRIGEGLLVVQVALATILASSALLLGVSFTKLMRVDRGFDAAGVAVAEVRLPRERYPSRESRQAFMAQVKERAEAIPGVEVAAISDGIPLNGAAVGSIGIPGRPEAEDGPSVWTTAVTPEYFRTMSIPLLRGQLFRSTPEEADRPILVNPSLARSYFPGEDPIGKTILLFGAVRAEIVGVVGDLRQRALAEEPPPQIYMEMLDAGWIKVSVKTALDAGDAAAGLRQVIRGMDPLLPIDRLDTLEGLVAESVASRRFTAVVVTGFSFIALLIAGLGVYALSAYTVSRRTRELGIRIALGATGGRIRRATVGRATVLAGVGVVAGLAGALAASRLLEAYLFGLSPTDPGILGGVMLLLVAMTGFAAFFPARRATRIDPMVVLRSD
jgi:predicted permease